jgi:hypothetical protein
MNGQSCGIWRTHADLKLTGGFQDRCVGRREHQAVTHTKGQQIAHRDGAFGRDGVVELGVRPFEDTPISQLGQEAIDGLIESQRAFLNQDHGGRCSDRFGHGGNAEDCVALDGIVFAQFFYANCVHVHLAALADERDETGYFSAVDVARHDAVHAGQPLGGHTCRRRRFLGRLWGFHTGQLRGSHIRRGHDCSRGRSAF